MTERFVTKYNIGDILYLLPFFNLKECHYLIEDIKDYRYYYRHLEEDTIHTAHYLALDENSAFIKVA